MIFGRPQLWHPDNLGRDQIIAWWSAADLTAGTITTWTDRLRGLAPTQGTAGKRPVAAATSFNSAYPGVTFDGTDDDLTIASTGTLITGTNPSIIFLVGTFTAGGAFGAGFAYGDTGAHAQRAIQCSTTSGLRISDGTTVLTDASGTLISSPRIIGCRWASVTEGGWIDTTATSGATTAAAFNTGTAVTTIGAGANLASFANVVISDIIVTADLTSADRARLEGWLAWNRGLTANLPSSHTYKNAAPGS